MGSLHRACHKEQTSAPSEEPIFKYFSSSFVKITVVETCEVSFFFYKLCFVTELKIPLIYATKNSNFFWTKFSQKLTQCAVSGMLQKPGGDLEH